MFCVFLSFRVLVAFLIYGVFGVDLCIKMVWFNIKEEIQKRKAGWGI